MTTEKFAEEMKKCAAKWSATNMEDSHYSADALMCRVLKSLGYMEGVKIFLKMEKWYS